ncbi:MAG: hypothetical protein VKJ27_01265 [Synechocystis sp.]|nr:hypothetical protein [Synechocystis sp.]
MFSSVKAFTLSCFLLLSASCSDPQSTQPPVESEEAVQVAGSKSDSPEIVKLHTTMLEALDEISFDDQIIHLDNASGEFKRLIVTELHPEVFASPDKGYYVLCVSASDKAGNSYPIDVYVHSPEQGEPKVFDVRIGDGDRKNLMELMKKGVFVNI